MNKKGIITIVVIVILIIIGYMVWGGKSSTVANNPATAPAGQTSTTPAATLPAGVTKDTVDSTLLGRLQGVSVSAAESGSRVALVNGKAQFTTDGVTGSIALGDVAVAASFGGSNYVFATLGVASAGSTSQYAVLFTDANGTLADQSYDLIGTGVQVTGLRADQISGGLVVTVSFKDASGATHSKILVVENGMFDSAKDISL